MSRDVVYYKWRRREMMGIKNEINKHQIEMFSLDQLVPENHLVRKIDKAIDLSFVRSLVANLYAANGAESIDPVVLIKPMSTG